MNRIDPPNGPAADQNMYVYLVPTVKCNIRHSFCFQQLFSGPELSDAVLYEKLRPLYERTAILRLHGGEITVAPRYRRLAAFLEETYPRLTLNVVTNGVLFDHRWRDLAEKGRLTVNFSLNAVHEEASQRILPGQNFRRLHQKIHENYQALAELHRSSAGNPLNATTMAVSEGTVSEVEPLARLALKYGSNVMYQFPCEAGAVITPNILGALYEAVRMKSYCRDHLTVNLIHPPARNLIPAMMETIEADPLYPGRRQAFFDSLGFDPRPAKTRTILTYESYSFEGPEAFVCPMPWRGLFISSPGVVFPCSNLPGHVLGNVNHDSLEDILQGPARLALREKVAARDYSLCWKRCNLNYFPGNGQ